jgi:hypothetical protein
METLLHLDFLVVDLLEVYYLYLVLLLDLVYTLLHLLILHQY